MTTILKDDSEISLSEKVELIRNERIDLLRNESVVYLTRVNREELLEILNSPSYYQSEINSIYELLFVYPDDQALKKYRLLSKSKFVSCLKCDNKFKSWGKKRCRSCHDLIESKNCEGDIVNL